MIIGNPERFAIESKITAVHLHRRRMAEGYFVYHVNGKIFGVLARDATYIGYAFWEAKRRQERRGLHATSFAAHPDSRELWEAVWTAVFDHTYDPAVHGAVFLGVERQRFYDEYEESYCEAHNRCGPAFDDGSWVLIFDVGDRVRVIARPVDIKRPDGTMKMPPFEDVWLSADEFYGMLTEWTTRFEAECRKLLAEEGRADFLPVWEPWMDL